MKRFTFTKKIGLVVIIVNISIIALGYYLFRDIKKRNNTVSAIEKELFLESSKEARYQSVKDIVEKTKADRDTIDLLFTKADEVVEFIELLESQGRTSGAKTTIASVRVEDTNASSTIETLVLEVRAEGSWTNTYHFFSLLENLPYSITLQTVALKTDSTGKDSHWQADFVIHVLKLK